MSFRDADPAGLEEDADAFFPRTPVNEAAVIAVRKGGLTGRGVCEEDRIKKLLPSQLMDLGRVRDDAVEVKDDGIERG
jgi:hypothetical protein